MPNYISNSALLNLSNSFDAALQTSRFEVAKAIKDTISDWWNKANSGLIDFESLTQCYITLKEMVQSLDNFQAELYRFRGHRGHENNDLEHENNKLARENEILKGQVGRLKVDNDNLDHSLDVANQALYNIHRYAKS